MSQEAFNIREAINGALELWLDGAISAQEFIDKVTLLLAEYEASS